MRRQRKQALLFISGGILSFMALIFLGYKTVFAEKISDQTIQEIEGAIIDVVVEPKDGYSQIVLDWKGRREQITEAAVNHTQPYRNGRYLVWVVTDQGFGQIERYNLVTGSADRLTTQGVHQKPRVNADGQAVWETWSNDTWQISYYDGHTTKLFGDGQVSINPDIASDTFIYATRSPSGEWQTIEHDLTNVSDITTLSEGISAKSAWLNSAGTVVYHLVRPRSQNTPLVTSIPDHIIFEAPAELTTEDTTELIEQGVLIPVAVEAGQPIDAPIDETTPPPEATP